MSDPVALWRAGEISAEVAVARLLLRGDTVAEIAGGPLGHVREPAALDRLAGMIAGIGHDATVSVQSIARQFDRLCDAAPVASVALYSLDDPVRLAAATAEIIGWLRTRDLLGGDVLDLGCGIGRMAEALAPDVRSVVGVDVSARMIAHARAGNTRKNVSYRVVEGHGLDTFGADSFDLILAVDSFPYLVQAGVADAHVAGAARVLRQAGVLAVLNLSYLTPAQDWAEARSWAARYGLTLSIAGERPFRQWDGAAYVFRRG